MKYSIYNKTTNKFTGVTYDFLNDEIVTHHSNQGDGIHPHENSFSIIESFSVDEDLNKTLTYKDVPDLTLDSLRVKRDELIKETDKYFLYGDAAPLPSNTTKQNLKDYRKALRDLPATVDLTGIKSVEEVNWPINPLS